MRIEDMQPGPEMDRLVVERILQWKLLAEKARGILWWDDGEWQRCTNFPGNSGNFSPSTSIADAWMVVEKMVADWPKRKPDTFRLEYDGCFTWFAGWTIDRDEVCYDLVEADTAPLAVCRAALLATLKEATPRPFPSTPP